MLADTKILLDWWCWLDPPDVQVLHFKLRGHRALLSLSSFPVLVGGRALFEMGRFASRLLCDVGSLYRAGIF